MLAAVLHDFDELRLEELPVPRAQSYGDVLLRIKSVSAVDFENGFLLAGNRRSGAIKIVMEWM